MEEHFGKQLVWTENVIMKEKGEGGMENIKSGNWKCNI